MCYYESRTFTGKIKMAGMLQVLTYLLCFYLVIKGLEVLQIGLASNRPARGGLVVLGTLTLIGCIIGAISFAAMQDNQAQSMSRSSSGIPQLR
jgi:hypothetical protein